MVQDVTEIMFEHNKKLRKLEKASASGYCFFTRNKEGVSSIPVSISVVYTILSNVQVIKRR